MTEPQVWTIIGAFIASAFGMMTLMSSFFVRILRAEIGSVHREISSLRNELKSDISALEARMDSKFNALDRDVQALVRREWGDPKP